MDTQKYESFKNERIEDLNAILKEYSSNERRSEKTNKRILISILFVGGASLYFVLSDFLGGIWGYILTLAIVMIGISCFLKLNIPLKESAISDGKLAYYACVSMEALIDIAKGTYPEHGIHICRISTGKHLDLYEEFILLYPTFENKTLKMLAKIEVTQKDIFN